MKLDSYQWAAIRRAVEELQREPYRKPAFITPFKGVIVTITHHQYKSGGGSTIAVKINNS